MCLCVYVYMYLCACDMVGKIANKGDVRVIEELTAMCDDVCDYVR